MEDKLCPLSWRVEHSWDQITNPNPVEWTIKKKFSMPKEIYIKLTYLEMLFFFPAGVFLSRHIEIVIKTNALHPEQDWQYMTNLHPLTVFSTSVFPTLLPVVSYITSPIISESCFSETDSFRKHFYCLLQ